MKISGSPQNSGHIVSVEKSPLESNKGKSASAKSDKIVEIRNELAGKKSLELNGEVLRGQIRKFSLTSELFLRNKKLSGILDSKMIRMNLYFKRTLNEKEKFSLVKKSRKLWTRILAYSLLS